ARVARCRERGRWSLVRYGVVVSAAMADDRKRVDHHRRPAGRRSAPQNGVHGDRGDRHDAQEPFEACRHCLPRIATAAYQTIDAASRDKFPNKCHRPCVFAADPLSLSPCHLESSKDSMRLSRYFLPILRETPKEAEIVSHRLMLRAGLIRQEAAGIYALLPLGFRVLQKICEIVREEQNRSGAIELLMPTMQSADLWRESGRYDAYGKEMLRISDRHERDMLFGPTNEEMITEI